MNQNELVLQHMQEHGSITSLEAISEYGCTRLSARIKDLREEGHKVVTVREVGVNRFGNKVNYARYFLGA